MCKLKIGISTCPNDTYIFGAAMRGDIEYPFMLDPIMDDVQYLNTLAMKSELDVVKVSFGVFPEISDNYNILKTGGALGFGCGPLLLSNDYSSIDELKGKKIAIPGKNTTAFMVFKMFFPECAVDCPEVRFDKIMPGIKEGLYDAGLVIHEGRFTYQDYSLKKILDMGVLWESRFHMPLPLGFIAVKKDCLDIAGDINSMIYRSIIFADNNPEPTYEYVRKYAQDMQTDVVKAHIKLYVNEYSKDLNKGADAISQLLGVDKSVII